MHDAKRKNPVLKTNIPNYSIYTTIWKRQKCRNRTGHWFPGVGVGEGLNTKSGVKKFFGHWNCSTFCLWKSQEPRHV